MHSNWRDCDAWKQEKLPMSSTSNEACKLYDVSLSQVVGLYENRDFDGLATSLNKLIAADPDFSLGHCLKLGVELLGSNALLNKPCLLSEGSILNCKADTLPITRREQMHVKAIQLLHKGALPEACDYWEQILIENPTDMMALRFAHSTYFYLGQGVQMRDSVARVLPVWERKRPPLGNYLYGMHAFGLVESNRIDEARASALKGLQMMSGDAWAAHAMSHANEYSGDFEKGIEFLLSTEKDWSRCDLIASHNYWHLALFNLELNRHDVVTQILDKHLMTNANSTLDLVNSASLLTRLSLDGFNGNEYLRGKWAGLKETYIGRIEDHGYLYSDFHMALVLSNCATEEEKNIYFKSLETFLTNHEGIVEKNNFLHRLNEKYSRQILNSVFCFKQGRFDEVIELLYPIRYDLFKIGGSRAQRDIFEQLLIHSALQSSSPINKQIGMALINQRLALVPNSSLIQRIAASLLTV